VAKEIDKALGRQAEDLKAAQRRTEFLTQVRSCMHFHVCVRVRACGCARACVRFYRHVLVRVPFSVGFAAHASPAPGWVWHVCWVCRLSLWVGVLQVGASRWLCRLRLFCSLRPWWAKKVWTSPTGPWVGGFAGSASFARCAPGGLKRCERLPQALG